MEPVLDGFNETEVTDTDQEPQTDADRTDGEETTTTPSQSRSSSIRPQPHLLVGVDVDVFDGYSFKGRHSVLIDDEEDEEGDESNEEEGDGRSILEGLEEESSQIEDEDRKSMAVVDDTSPSPRGSVLLEDGAEPKTPEARSAPLPPADEVAVPPVPEAEEAVVEPISMEEPEVEPEVEPTKVEEALPASQSTAELDIAEPISDVIPAAEVEPKRPSTPVRTVPSRQPASNGNRAGRSRREKSGVPALDRYLSDTVDEDVGATEAEPDEDEDWDFVEKADGEDRNGSKGTGTSLFARGVVDRYRLAVFRKASTPGSRSGMGMRSLSGMSIASGATVVSEATESPSPSQRRGRTPGLTFRKTPRQFLKPKSPPSSFSAKTARSLSQSASTSHALSAASHSALSPSLKSKESANSVGAQSQSSDQSLNGTSAVFVDAPDTIRGSPPSMGGAKHGNNNKVQTTTTGAEHNKVKNKKLRRYKHNAEKVFSLFSSPRQAS